MITRDEAIKLFLDVNITNKTKYSEWMDLIFTIKYFKRTFTPTEIKNSFSSKLELLPALPQNKIYLLFYGTIGYKLDFQSAAFNCGVDGMILGYGNIFDPIIAVIPQTQINAGSKVIAQAIPNPQGNNPYTCENKALIFGNPDADMTQGDSPVTLYFPYVILNFS